MIQLSYNEVDNVETQRAVAGAQIPGQWLRHCTLGLGYAFNKHVALNFNWVFIYASERTVYGGPKSSGNPGDALEQAWFFQMTIEW